MTTGVAVDDWTTGAAVDDWMTGAAVDNWTTGAAVDYLYLLFSVIPSNSNQCILQSIWFRYIHFLILGSWQGGNLHPKIVVPPENV